MIGNDGAGLPVGAHATDYPVTQNESVPCPATPAKPPARGSGAERPGTASCPGAGALRLPGDAVAAGTGAG